jgi:hypothetical protein
MSALYQFQHPVLQGEPGLAVCFKQSLHFLYLTFKNERYGAVYWFGYEFSD